MTNTQKVQLLKSKRDATLDLLSLGFFAGMVYFVMNPDKYDAMTNSITAKIHAVEHRLSIWQTTLSIRSLPETDGE